MWRKLKKSLGREMEREWEVVRKTRKEKDIGREW